MKNFLWNLLVILLLPLYMLFSVWDALLAFVKTFIKDLKDWSDDLTL